LGLPSTLHEEVAKLYEKALEKGLVRGRSIESIIAALVYSLCREYGTPRTLTEISQASGIEKRELGRTYRYISRKLNMRILPAKAASYIPRFASMLNLSDKVQVRAIDILKKARKKDVVSGKGPCGCAAAAIYIASVLQGERRTQREVADVVGVTEVTIRNRYKEIAEALNIEEEVEKKAKEEEGLRHFITASTFFRPASVFTAVGQNTVRLALCLFESEPRILSKPTRGFLYFFDRKCVS